MKKLVLLINLFLVVLLFAFQIRANATEQNSNESSVITIADEIIMFGEGNNRWFTNQPILDDAEPDYEFKSTNPVQKYYRHEMIIDRYINEEKYGLFGIDSTNETHRLEPNAYLYDPISTGANGYVHISISTVAQFPDPDYIARDNDTLKMKNMYSDLAISGDSTKVGYGKILYRTGQVGETWGNWSYVDLEPFIDTNASLSFYGQQCVQIVVIYEVKEKAPTIFQSNKFYHVRGIYEFMIV